MRLFSLCCYLAFFAALVFLPRVAPRRHADVWCIDEEGRDARCAPSYAWVDQPDRSSVEPLALLEDLSYAAAEADALGIGGLLAIAAFVSLIFGLWCGGVVCGVRRLVMTLALGCPIALALVYTSCFLEGRRIRLGPGAEPHWVAASLHTQTNRSTGILTPADLLRWHFDRGFRIVNISDRDGIESARETQAIARREGFEPPLLVLVGEERHGHPDLVLVNARRSWSPRDADLGETIDGARAEGAAVFVAHPWSKLERPLGEVLELGVDGVEVVNGLIHGGPLVLQEVRARAKSVVGVIDYKFGPHVNALTLIPRELAHTPQGVVRALRERRTRVLYAVPGGAVTGTAYEAGRPGWAATLAGLRSLAEVPYARRSVWFASLAVMLLLWRLATRERQRAERAARERGRRLLSPRMARAILIFSVVGELSLPAFLGWQVRALIGVVPVPWLIGTGAVLAVPLLAASQVLARSREGA